MSSQTVTTTAVFEAEERGVAQTAAALKNLEGAAKGTSGAVSQFGKVTETSAAKIGTIERGVDGLLKTLAGAPHAWRQYERDMAVATRGLDAGKLSAEGYARTVQQLQQQLQRVVAPRLNMDAGSSGLSALLGTEEKISVASREAARDLLKQAEAQKVVDAEAARSQALLAKSALKLKAELDPVGAAYAKMKQEIDDYQQMAAQTLITQDELAAATARSRKAFDDASSSLRPANDNVKLTSGQVQNLGYQLNDVTTMLAMGASPFQIITSQAGQVVQALGDGPGGVKGSLAAIGSSVIGFFRSLGPVGLALTATTVAAGGFWLALKKDVKPLTDAMDSYRDAVKALGDTYGVTTSKAMEFQSASAGVAGFGFRRSRAELEMSARQNLNDNFNPGVVSDFLRKSTYQQGLGEDGKVITEVAAKYKAFEAPILDLVRGMEKGTGRADLFVEAVANIANLNPSDEKLQELAKALIDMTRAAADAQRQLNGLGEAYSDTLRLAKQAADDAEKADAAYEKFRGSAFDLEGFKTERQRITESFEKFKATTMGPLNPKDVERYNSALGQLDAQDERIRKGRELDLKQVGARTVAERARIAAERERLNLTLPGIDKEKVKADAAAASQMVYAEAAESAAEALRSSRDAYERAGLEGYAAQVAGINAQYARQIELAQGSDAAVRALTQARDLDLQALQVSTQKSLFAGQAEQMRQLQAEAGLIGQTDEARHSALATLQAESELRRQGIDLNSTWGQTYVENARQIASMESALDRQTEAFEDMRDAARDFFEEMGAGKGVLESALSAFSKYGSKLSSGGFDQLFGSLYGGLGAGGRKGGGGISMPSLSLPVSANSNYASNAIVSAPLAALNDNLARTSRSALDVAKQFQGLNERADTKVLDSFLQASGTWKGMSAADYAWCASFANAAIVQAGGKGTGSNAASSFMGWGTATTQPKIGDVVVLRPQARGATGHVGFVAGFGDGTVQVFGGNQSHSAKVSNYSTREVVGYRTGVGTQAANSNMPLGFDQRAFQRATSIGVKNGLTDYSRQASYGDYTRAGIDPWNDGATDLRQTGSGFGQTALGALGAGLGIFSQGYQSASPFGGALSGAMGGFQAGSALFPALGAAGPVGAGIGAIVGIVGGILGKRKEKKQQEEEARRQWDGMQPQYEAYRRYLSGEESGNLRADFQNIQAQFNQFNAASTKAKNGDLVETARSFYAYVQKQLSEFREAFEGVAADLDAGAGLDGPFQKGKSAVKQLQKQLQGYLDDVAIAYFQFDNGLQGGAPFAAADAAWREQREAALATARRGAQNQALAVLNPPKELSSVENNFRSLQGAATQLLPTLQKLGLGATDAARRINEELNKALATMAGEFLDGFQRKVNDLSGLGYLNDVTDLLKEFDTALSNAKLLNVDPTLINRWFKLSAQGVVDGAELTGDAFAELVRAFPPLSGVVSEFVENARRTAKELDSLRRSYGDRVFEAGVDTSTEAGALSRFDRSANREREAEVKAGGQAMLDLERALAAERLAVIRGFREKEVEEAKRLRDEATSYLEDFTRDIKGYLDGLRAGSSSPLSGADRLSEAQKQFDAQFALAQSGDRDALGDITAYADRLLDANRSYNASSPEGQAIFDRITKALEDLPKQIRPEDLIKQAIEGAGKATVDAIAVMQATLKDGFAGTPQAAANALSVYFGNLDTSLNGLLSLDELRSGLAGIATDAQIRQMMQVLDVNSDGQLSRLELIQATTSAQTAQDRMLTQSQVDSLQTSAQYIGGILQVIESGQHTQLDNIFSQLSAMHRTAIGSDYSLWRIASNTMANNNKIGAPGYMSGGYTGGSSPTEVRGVVHGMEGVLTASAMQGIGIPALNYINREKRLPSVALPVFGSGAGVSNDNSALVVEVRALRQEVSRLREENNAVTRESGASVREGVDDLKSSADAGNRESRRTRRAV